MRRFETIRGRAAKRKGGEAALASLLPDVPSRSVLARLADDRVLSQMAQRIFSAGFVWRVVEAQKPKSPGAGAGALGLAFRETSR